MMKEKILKFIKERRELLVFLGVMVILFTAVITIAEVTLNSDDEPVARVDDTTGSDEGTPAQDDNTPAQEVKPKTMSAPIEGDYIIVRQYYDLNNESSLADAIIVNGTSLSMSKGIGFAKEDDSEFECVNTIDGKVLSITQTDLNGYVVEVDNYDGLVTTFYNLSSVNVSVDDEITSGMVIGKSGSSLTDAEASNHVFVEMTLNDAYINPVNYIGKTVDSIKSLEK